MLCYLDACCKGWDWQYQIIFNKAKEVELISLPNFPLFTEEISGDFNLSVLIDRFHPNRFNSKSGLEAMFKTKPFSLKILGEKVYYNKKTLLIKLYLLHPLEKYTGQRYRIEDLIETHDDDDEEKFEDAEHLREILKKYPNNYIYLSLE